MSSMVSLLSMLTLTICKEQARQRKSMRHSLLFERLVKYGIVINPSKYQFGVSSFTFLGHVVDNSGICPLEICISSLIVQTYYISAIDGQTYYGTRI